MAASIGAARIEMSINSAQFTAQMKNMRNAVGKYRTSLQNVKRTFRRVGYRMERLGSTLSQRLTLPLSLAAGAAIKASSDYEMLRVQLETLTGSAEAGSRAFERLRDFSAETPFQLQDLAKANNTLLGFSLSADESFESIKQIGDIAAVTGGDIQSIAVAFGQSAAEGKLFTRDIRQFINQGVPAVTMLAETLGVAESQVFDLAEQGKISFDTLQRAFEQATEAGGQFADGAERTSQTLQGLFSTFRDRITDALAQVGDALAETFNLRELISRVSSNIQTGIDWFNELSGETRRIAFYMAGLLGASGPVIAALGALSVAIGSISAPVAGIATAIGGAGFLIIKNWDQVKAYFTEGEGAQMWDTLKRIVSGSISFVTGLWDTFGDNILTTAEYSFKATLEVIELTMGRIKDVMDSFNGEFDNELRVFEDNILTTLRKIDSKIIEFTGSFAGWLYKEFIEDPAKVFGIFRTEAEKREIAMGRHIRELNRIRQMDRPSDFIFDADVQIPDVEIPFARRAWVTDIEKNTSLAKRYIGSTRDVFNRSLEDMIATGSRFSSASEAHFALAAKSAVDVAQIFQSLLPGAITSFGEALGNAFTGDAGAKGFFDSLLKIVVDFTNRFGRLLVAAGIAAQTFKKLLVNPAAAIFAGTALIAASTAVKNLLRRGPEQDSSSEQDSRAQGMAQGGIVPSGFPNDSYPAMLTSGERVIPEPMPLGSGGMFSGRGFERSMEKAVGNALAGARWKVRGSDLVLVTARGKQSYS